MALAQARDEVLRQARDEELQLRRETAHQRSEDYQQAIRVREKQLEAQAAAAARKMLGMRQFQDDLQGGMTPAQALTKNAENLFADHPERFASAIRGLMPAEAAQPGWTPSGQEYMQNPRSGAISFTPQGIGAPGEMVVREALDPQGRPTGVKYVPSRGMRTLRPEGLSPEGNLRRIQTLLFQIERRLRNEPPNSPEAQRLMKNRDALEKELEAMGRGPGVSNTDAFDASGRVPGKEDEEVTADEEEE